jgi:hypothetical protein
MKNVSYFMQSQNRHSLSFPTKICEPMTKNVSCLEVRIDVSFEADKQDKKKKTRLNVPRINMSFSTVSHHVIESWEKIQRMPKLG